MTSNDEKWESESLEWIHQIRAERSKRSGGKIEPIPRAEQKALAEKHGFEFIPSERRLSHIPKRG